MPDGSSFVPEITDDDIDWVRNLLRLNVLDAPRRAFLTARNTLDVSACPGSGKTTLIVAKLAILARKWPYRTKGICVLSHTNVAREEIQRRLGSTVAGHRLLSYPHFIDTIHGFVNRFLALPWLNSNGFPSPTIDNDVTTAYRHGVLGKEYCTVQKYLEQKHSGFDRLRICKRDLSFDLGGKPFPAGQSAKSFKLAKQAVEAAAKAGYFCYDEMFVWAHALLEDFPAAASWLRRRFPLVIIDEMQDTFDDQGALLHKVFTRTLSDIVVQRVGDPNQAIFDDSEAEPDKCDQFPDQARCLGIPNSLRFGPEIAALASPLAVTPVGTDGLLCGIGPKTLAGAPAACPHAVFIFPDDSTEGVLDAYGKHVLAIFDDCALANGSVTAVGGVHQDASNVAPGHKLFPKSVPHYWSGYTSEICRKEPHPKLFVQYVRAAQAVVRQGRDFSPGVERIAAGIIRLATFIGDAGNLKRKTRAHRTIVDALGTNATALSAYHRLIIALLIDRMPLIEENWGGMHTNILSVAYALSESVTDQAKAKADSFLKWSGITPSVASSSAVSSNDHGSERGR